MKYSLKDPTYQHKAGCGGPAHCATQEIINNSRIQNKIANMNGGAVETGPVVPSVVGASNEQNNFFNKMAKLSVINQEHSRFDNDTGKPPITGGKRITKKSKKRGGRKSRSKSLSQPRSHAQFMGTNLDYAGHFPAKQGGKKRRTRKRHGKGGNLSLPKASEVPDATNNVKKHNPSNAKKIINRIINPLPQAEASFQQPLQYATPIVDINGTNMRVVRGSRLKMPTGSTADTRRRIPGVGGKKKTKKFKKHYMWNTKGKRYMAKTYKQHLRGVKLGHTHKKPKKSKRRTKKRGGADNGNGPKNIVPFSRPKTPESTPAPAPAPAPRPPANNPPFAVYVDDNGYDAWGRNNPGGYRFIAPKYEDPGPEPGNVTI